MAAAPSARNADALIRLVDEVFDTSAIVTGKLQLKLAPCELSTLVSDAVEIVRADAESKALNLAVTIEPGLVLFCDAHRIRQALWNVLSNAVKFTQTGHVRVTVTREGDRAHLSVEDTGIGLAPEALPNIFERFWQADVTQTREHGGLGLGLSLARHFIELHGGQISAQSPGIGHGTTFDIHLPLTGGESGTGAE